MTAGPGRKPIPPPAIYANGIRARSPEGEAESGHAEVVESGYGLEAVRVTASNPAAASTAMPALDRTAVSRNPDGRPTSRQGRSGPGR